MLYPSSLSDQKWEVIKEIFEDWGYSDENRTHSLRLIIDAILYVVDNGIKWRSMPKDFPPWQTIYYNFRRWTKEGLWFKVNLTLVSAARYKKDRDCDPSLVSIDSQSQDAEPGIFGRGLDGNKKRNGRKRHYSVDVMGLLLICICTSANESDKHAGATMVDKLNDTSLFPNVQKILGDSAYDRIGENQKVPVTVEASMRKKGQKGFVPEAFRWVVERTFAWINRQRRMVRNYEKLALHQEAMNYIANIRLCLNKIFQE